MTTPRLTRLPSVPLVTAVVVGGAIAGAALSLTPYQAMADSPAPPVAETQATVKPIGFGISRITLQPRAARRLDIQTAVISEDTLGRKMAPYASIIYDLDGDAWVYAVKAPLTYLRESVTIKSITGDFAYLSEGPAVNTAVVTTGAPELYGTEVGVNGE